MSKNDQIIVGDIFGKRRSKKLNILFFVSASKTYSFSLPITLSAILASVLAAMFIWSFMSLTWLTQTKLQNNKLDAELKLLKSKIFEYQSRYEDIYGINNSQPNLTTDKNLLGQNTSNQSKTPHLEKSSAVIKPTEAKPIEAKPTEIKQPQLPENKDHANTLSEDTETSIEVRIDNFNVSKHEETIYLKFNMVNTDKEMKTQQGTIKAIAYVKESNGGKVLPVPAILGQTKNPNGKIVGPGEIYRIQKFNQKQLAFQLPSQSAQLIEVEVQVHSCNPLLTSECKEISSYKINANQQQNTGLYKLAIQNLNNQKF